MDAVLVTGMVKRGASRDSLGLGLLHRRKIRGGAGGGARGGGGGSGRAFGGERH